jgi:hypothetical protein
VKRLVRRLVFLAIAGGVAAFGCNLVLGIEEHEARPPDAASDVEAPAIDGARPNGDRCTTDGDCSPPNPCYKPHCDTTLGVCRFTLCESARACAAGVCNPQTLSCEDERDYGFRATTYGLGELTLGCKKNPSACVGAVYPFLFVGTKNEVAALRVDDLRGIEARTVPLIGLTVRPGQIVVSGRRVWILGDVQGTEPPYVLPIASIDVPADPTAREIRAKSAAIKYPFPTAVGFAAPNAGLYVAFNDATQNLPAALVDAPLSGDAVFAVTGAAADGGASVPNPPGTPTHTMFRTTSLPPGATLVASSGARLVAYRFPVTFNLIGAPGTAEATAQPDTALAPPLPAYLLPRFAQGPDGVVLLSTAINADPPGDCNCSSHQRVQWVLPNAIAPTAEANQLVDPEGYSNPNATPASPCHTCAYFAQPSIPAWLDAKSALVAAPASDPAANRTLTSVRLLEREPIAAPPKRRVSTAPTDVPTGNFATDRIALVASGGLGFLVVADGEGSQARLSVFDPRCDNN